MFDKLKRLFSKPVPTNANAPESRVTLPSEIWNLPVPERPSSISNEEAAKTYNDVKTKLVTATGFHVVHCFTFNQRYPHDFKYRLEGDAVAWNRIQFQFFGDQGFDGEWITKAVKEVNSIDEIKAKIIKHRGNSSDDKILFLYYHKKEAGWQLEPLPEPLTSYNFLPVEAIDVISFDIFGNSYRATRDIEYKRDEVFEGEECEFYEWALDAGGYYELWVSKRTRNVVCIQQIMPWGSSRTIFSKIDEPVYFDEPE